MKKYFNIILLSICLISLSGCISREQADATLVKGCLAGVKSLLPEYKDIKEVINTTVKPSPIGNRYRHIDVQAIELDGWLEVETDYQCVFEESFGFMKASHTAVIHQIHIGEKFYGKAGNNIEGSTQDFIRLTDAIREAMYE